MSQPLQPYPAYKSSGVEWLGDVPAHWEQLPGRACYTEKKVPNVGMQESTVLSLSYGRIVVRPPEKLRGLVPESFETYQIIYPGDIVVRATDLQNDWNSLRFGLCRRRGIITSAYICLKANGVMSRDYGHLLLHSYDLKKVFYGLGSGLRQNLSWDDFRYLPCLVPPLAEQRAIVRYLDRANRRIQRYIEAKENLIAFLQEARQAIVQRAITRGLDPDRPLKPSGVDWLGDVPAHWEVRRLKSICRFLYGDSLPVGERTHGKIPVYGSNGMVGSHSGSNARGPCLIIGRKGSFGKVHYSPDSTFAIDTTFFVDNRSTDANLRWLYYLLLSLKLDSVSKDSAVPGLNREDAYRQIGLYPPLPEQRAIAAHLDQATAAIDRAIENARRQSERMAEYRASLFVHVVTGKLDVRAAAAQLPIDNPAETPVPEQETIA